MLRAVVLVIRVRADRETIPSEAKVHKKKVEVPFFIRYLKNIFI
jgi:hypothetical protein